MTISWAIYTYDLLTTTKQVSANALTCFVLAY
jgi:hypothetical protein